MDHLLVVLLLLWSSGLQTEGKHSSTETVRLVGGNSRCAGTLEVKDGEEWKPVNDFEWTLKTAAVVCRELDCGSAVSLGKRKESSRRPIWWISPSCVQPEFSVRTCERPSYSKMFLTLSCSDSVRLVNGTSLCSGRLEVKSDQSSQSWSSVCEADFDQQDAEVVCRELGCGAPSVLQGALYGEAEAPMWTKEFQCGGRESALLDCRSSGSTRNTCSPGKAVGLTCSEPVRLVGGDSRCAGTLELKHQEEWRPVSYSDWSLKTAAVVCRELDCGSAVSVRENVKLPAGPKWRISSSCFQSGSALRDCVTPDDSVHVLKLNCSYSVRLVNGTSLCSGRLEVKSDQSSQSWSSVCEADFDQPDAEVVCRELGCGAPSVLQGALYGEVEAPKWTKEFQCGGRESALLDCRSSDSTRNTCSPGKAVGLTCSEPVRLVGGDSRCAGTLELKHQGEWRPVSYSDWSLKTAAVACRELDCGSAVSIREREESSDRSVWWIRSNCVQSGSALRDCGMPADFPFILNLTCLDSVRLVNGTSLCSGRLEVKSDQSSQSWSSVCEADFDQPDAEVVCRELGCGAPSILQGALYGEVEALKWTKDFQCGGRESALLDCGSSGSTRNTCSPGKAVGLTCSEPVRLVGGDSRCAGTLELKQQEEWRPVSETYWSLKTAAVVCRELDCGTVVSVRERRESSARLVWRIWSKCVQSGSAVRDCVASGYSPSILSFICSDLLILPQISVASSKDWVSDSQQQVFRGSNFTIRCSIQPQYSGGSFQLTFTSSNTAHNYTNQLAVNHSAHFLFPAAEPAHQGSYSCVYHVYVFSRNFSSESRLLSLTVLDPSALIIRVVALLLMSVLFVITALHLHCKVRRQQPGRQENIELDRFDPCVSAADGELDEEEEAPEAESDLQGAQSADANAMNY